MKEYSSSEDIPSDPSLMLYEWPYRSEFIAESVGSITNEDEECYMADNENSDKESRIKRKRKRSLFLRLRKAFGGTASDADDEHT